jgi:hypothetical protein
MPNHILTKAEMRDLAACLETAAGSIEIAPRLRSELALASLLIKALRTGVITAPVDLREGQDDC